MSHIRQRSAAECVPCPVSVCPVCVCVHVELPEQQSAQCAVDLSVCLASEQSQGWLTRPGGLRGEGADNHKPVLSHCNTTTTLSS